MKKYGPSQWTMLEKYEITHFLYTGKSRSVITDSQFNLLRLSSLNSVLPFSKRIRIEAYCLFVEVVKVFRSFRQRLHICGMISL